MTVNPGSQHHSPEQGLRDGYTDISLANFTEIMLPTLRVS